MPQSVVMLEGGHQSTVVGAVSEVEKRISDWQAYVVSQASSVPTRYCYLDTNGGGQVAVNVDRVVAVAGRTEWTQ